ncbi:hypothetical protein ABIB50_004144 [Mucilaginibacter sp. UYCu711]
MPSLTEVAFLLIYFKYIYNQFQSEPIYALIY